jgi:NAD(P)-dependent dehydrogenase (short-subunit alcohol dehydrogenase family)
MIGGQNMSIPSLSLKGKVAIVTGAGSVRGIGRAIALTLAEAGADVVICDLHAQGESYDLEGLADEIRKLGRCSLAVQADISKENEVNNLTSRVVKEFGALDIMVNNAGISAHETILKMTTELWDKAMDVNLKGTYLCCQAAGRLMAKRGQGNIINISSIGGMRLGGASAYGIAKAGVIVLTGWVARELAQYNIRVNAIAPGGVSTDFGLHRLGRAPWDIRAELGEPAAAPSKSQKSTVPLGRSAEPEDIAYVALFLASDLSRYITGQTIVVDGGVMLGN